MHKRINAFFMDWCNGLLFVSVGVITAIMIHIYRNDVEFIAKMQKGLPYDLAIFLLGIVLIACGIQSMSGGITKLLWKNDIIRNWFIAYQSKRKNKHVR